MQLEGATDLERRLSDTCLRVEKELPASELATSVVIALSEAGQRLQQLRAGAETVLRAVAHDVQSWDGEPSPADVLEEVADRMGLKDVII